MWRKTVCRKTYTGLLIPGLLLALLILGMGFTPPALAELSPADWGAEGLVLGEGWVRYATISDDGSRVAALLPYSGADENSRHVVLTEKIGGVWQAPVVLATNGHLSHENFQWMPQYTHPVISGDGQTVVYLGYTGETFAAYMVTRQQDGSWRAPALIPAGLPNVHYWLALSRDGQTLALADYPFLETQHVYILTRSGDNWSAPARVTPTTGLLSGGGMPSLSGDGRRLVYVHNARVTFAEWVDGTWQAPQELTDNLYAEHEVAFPQLSRDGRAIYYWLLAKEPTDTGYLLVGQDLYVMRHTGAGWGAPEKITPSPIPVSLSLDGPAAANETATRIVYTRPITETDPIGGDTTISRAELRWAEWQADGWQTITLVEGNEFGDTNKSPILTPDGLRLIFIGGKRTLPDQSQVHGGLWQKETSVAPPGLPLPSSTGALIPEAGGALFSEIDQTRYDFPAGTFTESVAFTHTVWSNLPLPPTGQIGFGGLGQGFAATAQSTATGLPVQPSQPVTVTIGYSPGQIGPIIPGTLCLWWMDGNGWSRLPSQDDPVQGRVTAAVDHFSHFALFGETRLIFLPAVQR